MQKKSGDLARALAAGEIRPHYQAIVNADGVPRLYESLARWKGFEEIGARIVFEAAADEDLLFSLYLSLAESIREDTRNYGISRVCVNISPLQLSDRCHLKKLAETLDPERVIIEVTESDPLSPSGLKGVLHLKEIGYKLAIDDFPCNHAGLDRLFAILPEIVKFDRRFLLDSENPAKSSFIRYFTNFCREQSITTAAEGIESLEKFNSLKELGIDYFQGYEIHRHELPENLSRYLSKDFG
jgi:EAL domain-containing protein (putative c-di-GMP-specific phosphodiesterase class I)